MTKIPTNDGYQPLKKGYQPRGGPKPTAPPTGGSVLPSKPVRFDPYQMAVYLENIISLTKLEELIDEDSVEMIERNAVEALVDLRRAFPKDVPNPKK